MQKWYSVIFDWTAHLQTLLFNLIRWMPSSGRQFGSMRRSLSENVCVCSVEGNFDDAQTGVKLIFSDKDFAEKLDKSGVFLSSANSINWGRLLPQLAYYFSAYCDFVNAGKIKLGDEIDFCVPTGNFGDILAGWYAKKMGLPVRKLICASNCNNVLTDFIKTKVGRGYLIE